MSKYLIFSNPGEIDIRLISTFGVNVKPESNNPIGYFGTGLKYALAVAKRLGGEVNIFSGRDRYEISSRRVEFRGKEFDQIEIIGPDETVLSLGFTTELGKGWEAWEAVRELHCNAKDEGGETRLETEMDDLVLAQNGQTRIVLTGEPFISAWASRHEWLLESRPLVTMDGVELHSGQTNFGFYRGIRVCKFSKPSKFTLNLTTEQRLTENRTLDEWHFKYHLGLDLVSSCEDEEVIKRLILKDENHFEGQLAWPSYMIPSQTFIKVIDEMYDSHRGTINETIIQLCQSSMREREVKSLALTELQEKIYSRAKAFAERLLREEINEPIIFVETLGSFNLLGLASKGKIYLPTNLFDKGTKYLASTLIEEHVHIKHGLRDCSREMQQWLFDKLVSLREEWEGEPI